MDSVWSVDIPFVNVAPVAISATIDEGGSGGGGAAPHWMSPANAVVASRIVNTVTAQSWRRGFIKFFSWVVGLQIAAGVEAKPTSELSGRIIPYRVICRILQVHLQSDRKVSLT